MAISRLASKTFERLKRALKLDLEGTLEAGFEEIPEAGMVCGFGTGRHSQGWLRRLTLPQVLCGKFQPMSADLPVEWPPTIMPKGHEAALVSVPLGGTIFNGGCVDMRSRKHWCGDHRVKSHRVGVPLGAPCMLPAHRPCPRLGIVFGPARKLRPQLCGRARTHCSHAPACSAACGCNPRNLRIYGTSRAHTFGPGVHVTAPMGEQCRRGVLRLNSPTLLPDCSRALQCRCCCRWHRTMSDGKGAYALFGAEPTGYVR
jgi:hypothetical protein